MPRMMSFALTTDQVRDRTKTLTRRLGWRHLKAGDRLTAVTKAQGLKKGEHPEVLAQIEVVSVRREPLCAITAEEIVREGFGEQFADLHHPVQFIAFFCRTHQCEPSAEVARIEFRYLDEVAP